MRAWVFCFLVCIRGYVCVSRDVCVCDSPIFQVWMFGDTVSACLKEDGKIIFEEILFY